MHDFLFVIFVSYKQYTRMAAVHIIAGTTQENSAVQRRDQYIRECAPVVGRLYLVATKEPFSFLPTGLIIRPSPLGCRRTTRLCLVHTAVKPSAANQRLLCLIFLRVPRRACDHPTLRNYTTFPTFHVHRKRSRRCYRRRTARTRGAEMLLLLLMLWRHVHVRSSSAVPPPGFLDAG